MLIHIHLACLDQYILILPCMVSGVGNGIQEDSATKRQSQYLMESTYASILRKWGLWSIWSSQRWKPLWYIWTLVGLQITEKMGIPLYTEWSTRHQKSWPLLNYTKIAVIGVCLEYLILGMNYCMFLYWNMVKAIGKIEQNSSKLFQYGSWSTIRIQHMYIHWFPTCIIIDRCVIVCAKDDWLEREVSIFSVDIHWFAQLP